MALPNRRRWPDPSAPPAPLEKGHGEGEPVSMRVALSRRFRGATGRPRLIWDRHPKRPAAMVLFLHGGAVRSHLPVSEVMPGFLRVSQIAQVFRFSVRGPVAVVRLRFGILGWNDERMSPVADTRWALEHMRARYPGVPIVLVGHSMGGRVVLHLADEPDVIGVVGLAPWIEPGDPEPSNSEQRLLMLHGDLDVVTSLRRTTELVDSLQAKGMFASLGRIARSGHGMLLRHRVWSAAATGFIVPAINAATGAGLTIRGIHPASRVAAAIRRLANSPSVVDL